MISFRQADLLDSLKETKEYPEVHISVNVEDSNLLEIDLNSMFISPSYMKDELVGMVLKSLTEAGFYRASDGTICWVVNEESDIRPVDQIINMFPSIKRSFRNNGFSIYDSNLYDIDEIRTGLIMRFILEVKK